MFQQGTYAPDSNYRWMGSMAMDQAGDIAVGYSLSSGSIHPSIAFTGRVPSDILGTLESENLILVGGGSQLSGLNRWGDYTSLSVDPVDDCTFWYTNQYQPSDGAFNWGTHLASFRFPSCGTVTTPDFALTATPAMQTVYLGASNSYTLTVTPVGGFTGTVSFSVSGLPSGATASFSPTSVTDSGTTTMTVTVSPSATVGSYSLDVTGTSGSLSHTIPVLLFIKATDFSLSVSPSSRTVIDGAKPTYKVKVTGTAGFTGTVTFSMSGVPSGSTAAFSPTSVTGSGSTTLTVTTTSATAPGTYVLTVTGTSDTLVHTITCKLIIAPGDFSISASPSSQMVTAGSSTTYTVTVTPSGGFTGTVTLSVSGLPSGTTRTFNPTSIVSSGSSTLTVTTSVTTPIGTKTLTITGSSLGVTHSTTVTLTVN